MGTRESLLEAGIIAFDSAGFGATTVAALCAAAGVSNGSFFHCFGTKEGLAAAIYLDSLCAYHAHLVQALDAGPDAAAGIAALVQAHLDWVVQERRAARFLFEQARAEWLPTIHTRQQAENQTFAARIDAWRGPLVQQNSLRPLSSWLFFSQLIGPAQMLCRAWLSGTHDADPRQHAASLIDCAQRALLVSSHP